jgi:ABC-2 type transport system ATP-binding protein
MQSNNVIIVDQVIKKFGKNQKAGLWTQIRKRFGRSGIDGAKANQSKPSKNGKKKEVLAVNKVSFEVGNNEVFGVLGPNGSGKSTLIRLLATLLLPDEGKITIMGFDPETHPMQVQEKINRVSVEASFFKKLSPMENLIYGARLYGKGGKETREEIVKILTRLGLEKNNIYRPMEEMSRGMQQKVAIARALLSKPEILLLDEPTTGLDPVSKREVQAVIRELVENDGTTILLTTHDMFEADILCNRVAIMHKGKIIALDTPEELKKTVSSGNGKETTLEDVFIHLTGDKLREHAE